MVSKLCIFLRFICLQKVQVNVSSIGTAFFSVLVKTTSMKTKQKSLIIFTPPL